MKGYKGFTLIELLIVVAIIAILAAIAIPNFLAAQTRSKVSKVKAEMQSMATALESYYVDNNIYPRADAVTTAVPPQFILSPVDGDYANGGVLPRALTTPVSFISNLFKDPFRQNGKGFYGYNGGPCVAGQRQGNWPGSGWIISSYGPDVTDGYGSTTLAEESAWNDNYMGQAAGFKLENSPFTYDPTNGTTSGGDVWRRGP